MVGVFLAAASGVGLHAQDESIDLNFPESISVESLVALVSEKQGLRILYDANVASKKVTIRAPGPVPPKSLTSVLQSALRMSDLALVEAGAEGWLKIVEVGKLPRNARSGDAEDAMKLYGADSPITQSFLLKHVDPDALQQTINLFLTPPSGGPGGRGGNSVAVTNQRVLIVTDYASNVARIAKLIQLIDQPRPDVKTQFIKAKHVDAETLSEKLGELLSARQKARESDETSKKGGVEVTFDGRTNQVIVIGESVLVEQVQDFLKVLDVPLDTRSEIYSPVALQAQRLDKLVRDLLELDEGQTLYRSAIDDEENLLVVSTTSAVHRRIVDLVQRLDRPADQSRSPVRFYKLVYATADDVLQTIRAMTGASDTRTGQADTNRRNGRFNLRQDGVVPGQNRAALNPQQPLEDRPRPPTAPPTDQLGDVGGINRNEDAAGRDANLLQLASDEGFELDFDQGRARVTADANTNTLIVVAPANVQAIYARLIKQLDKPRPQVLIEAKVVLLDTSDDFALGVELSGGDRVGARRLFAFSSFGLSNIDPVNGALSVLPGIGFNGTLVDPQVADVVLRALSTHQRAKVITSPRILVNDNATGRLSSVAEVPFTSVNASQTVATTSFAGFAEAGTTIEVTPHISEGDQLQIEYLLTINEFQPGGGGDVPPPRQTDELQSEVTIPDGYTIIVGGMNRTSHGVTTDSIPFLEHIPILKHAVTNRTNQFTSTAVFVFLKAVILRDDKFRDLKYFSERDVFRAYIPGDYPVSQPLLIR